MGITELDETEGAPLVDFVSGSSFPSPEPVSGPSSPPVSGGPVVGGVLPPVLIPFLIFESNPSLPFGAPPIFF